MTTPEMRSAVARHAKVNHLAGLNEAIGQVKLFLAGCESLCIENLGTAMVTRKAAALVDDLQTRAALLEKQIGG